MNTRFLFVLSLVVMVFAVWFYRNQGELDSVVNLAETNIEYQATDILAVQTNDEGVAEYALTADELTHYSAQNADKLIGMTLNWRPNASRNVVINANEATMFHEQDKVVMTDNVLFSSQNAHENSDTISAPIKLEAQKLIGDLNSKQVYSDTPIQVVQAKNSFEAADFSANLQTGEYDFSKVAVTFMPPKRKDVPLF